MHKQARESNTNVCSFNIVINVVAVRFVCVAKDKSKLKGHDETQQVN